MTFTDDLAMFFESLETASKEISQLSIKIEADLQISFQKMSRHT